MCSDGAVPAAHAGRGIRFEEAQDYQFMLPPLPTGYVVLNTVFLHADMKGRPYRVEDFRDALHRHGTLPEVSAMGAYQMNHVWAVTFKSAEGKKKMLETTELIVKGRRCVVVDPSHQDVRVKLHWLLFNVADDDVREALTPYGRVLEVTRERWRVDGCQSVGTMTRTAVLRLKAGVTCEDIPHQLRVGGELALVVVPGRAPLCLRCQQTGHIRKECRAPRCNLCRRFGHEATQCVRTYAAAAAPVGSLERCELLMDEGETEDAATGSTVNTDPGANTPSTSEGGASSGVMDSEAPAAAMEQGARQEESEAAAPAPTGAEVDDDKSVIKKTADDVAMADAPAGSVAAKRTRDDGNVDNDELKRVEPPPKTVPLWRRRAPVKPNAPVDDRTAGKPPP
ncbi:uncharacterized protein ISCGN_027424 [Ixodes scapularis]